MPCYRPVTAALRSLEILRVVSRLGEASVGLIHQETGIDKATIVRMLQTLIHAGYVVCDRPAAYRVTVRTMELSSGARQLDTYKAISAPILAGLSKSADALSIFAVHDEDAMVVVAKSNGEETFRERGPGFRAPILLTSLGRAYLAHCRPDTRGGILEKVRSMSPASRLPSTARIEAMLKGVRRQGFAVIDDAYSRREYGGHAHAVAVPVSAGGRLIGAVNLMLDRRKVGLLETVRHLVPQLQRVAEDLGGAFAGSRSEA